MSTGRFIKSLICKLLLGSTLGMLFFVFLHPYASVHLTAEIGGIAGGFVGLSAGLLARKTSVSRTALGVCLSVLICSTIMLPIFYWMDGRLPWQIYIGTVVIGLVLPFFVRIIWWIINCYFKEIQGI